VAVGANPAAEKRAAREAAKAAVEAESDRVSTVAAAFIERYARRNVGASWSREMERLFAKEILPRLGSKRLSKVTRPDIHAILDEIADRAPIVANRVLAVCSRFGRWAVERGYVERSPFEGIKAPSPEVGRERVLSDPEIKLVWRAFDHDGWPFGMLGKLLLLTGARLNEIASGQWSEIDLEAKTWTIGKERSKNGVAFEIPLSETAVDILNSLPRIAGKPGYVLTVNGRAPVRGFSAAKDRIDRLMTEAGRTGKPWVYHDLRRTVATNMQRLGVRLEVTEAILNHVSGSRRGIVGIYQRHEWKDEKRQALDAWARRLDEIVTGEAVSNVVQLKR
jgi:integrase